MMSKSYLLSFAKAKGNIAAVALAAVLMAANATVASAQNKATASNGTEKTVIGGVDDLPGIDPSETYCTNGTNETNGDKIVCLYNVGAKKFLSIGSKWGTHASLNVSPYSIYMIWNSGSKTYFLQNKVEGSGTGPYMGVFKDKDGVNGVFMDRKENCAITFEQAKDYSKTNKVYLVKINTFTPKQLGYLTAYPNDENKLCDYQESKATEGTQEYKNQEWKVITKNEYYKLFNTAPANMKSVVDASFLITCPDFRIHDAGAAKWIIKSEDQSANVNSHVRFGDETMYKTYDKVSNTKDEGFTGRTEAHQQKYGQYFYCYTKGLRGFTFYQDVKVHKGGWFLLRCNGFSTANSSENITTNGKPLANLFITELDAQGNPNKDKYSTATLNGISQADAEALGKTDEGAGIGHAFFEGEYENQVQICLDKAPNGNEISNDNPVTLRIGFYVDPTPNGKPDVAANELTAVDEFKLLYAGPRRNPELILDEESTDLLYLTKAADEYKNSVLHLNRKLNDNMWNSLILPVNLTWGQMKRTFGDAVKVAKLEALTENSVQFVTVEPKNDDDVMVTAFEPYIVYPPYTQVKSAPYTVDRFYTSKGEDNSSWLDTNYESSSSEDNRLTKTLKADHYDITMVSLDREKLMQHVNTSNWESKTKFDATGGGHGTMTCKGTMAKTYDNGKIIEGRDDLNGDYFMYKGKLIQVPHGNKENSDEPYSYGLKAFRCWFELPGNATAKPSQVSLLIDGVEDSTTGIDDIHGSTDRTSYKRGIEGVFNINGQMVRRSCSLEGLPKGMYVVNGKKIIIR
uniref:hypothetical protein n=1 Tax=Segatella hominis TaxID=2518605 RepID=UPI00403879E9